MTIRTFKFKLEPTKTQESSFIEWCGSVRFVYNWFLALTQKRQYVIREGEPINRNTMNSSALLTALKSEHNWLQNVSSWTLNRALRDVDASAQAVIRFRKEGRVANFRFRNKYEDNSFRCAGVYCKIINDTVVLPKIGAIQFRNSRKDQWPTIFRLCEVTVKLGRGKWYVCISLDYPTVIPENNEPPLGIDRGVVQTLTFSDMTEPRRMPVADLRLLQAKAEEHQRVVSQRVRGSKRRHKAVQLLASVKAKIARAIS